MSLPDGRSALQTICAALEKAFMCAIFKTLLLAAAVLAGSSAMACKRIMFARLSFAADSAEIDSAQIVKLAEFVRRANSTYAHYLGVSIEGGASVKLPGRTHADAKQLARRRAENVARAYRQLQSNTLKVEMTFGPMEDNGMSREASNDAVWIQFHLDYEALRLPDCNPVPIPGFKPEH